MGLKLIIEIVWSNNIFLPKATRIRKQSECNKKYYVYYPSNSFKNYCYRLKLKIVKTSNCKF